MIQLNLLPAVKLEYVKARRNRRLATLGSAIVAGVSLLILVLLFSSTQLQAKHSRDLSADIKTESEKLQNVENISSILTIQNQLKSLENLNNSKPEADRIAQYLEQITPAETTYESIEVDFTTQTISLKAKGSTVARANQHVDTLKFTEAVIVKEIDQGDGESTEETTKVPAFSEVVLSNVSTAEAEGKGITYQITFKFNPEIFSNVPKSVKLVIPEQTTTRSEINTPGSVFAPQKEEEQ
jgi:hypothetical protein